jgi:hypothetical protein
MAVLPIFCYDYALEEGRRIQSRGFTIIICLRSHSQSRKDTRWKRIKIESGFNGLQHNNQQYYKNKNQDRAKNLYAWNWAIPPLLIGPVLPVMSLSACQSACQRCTSELLLTFGWSSLDLITLLLTTINVFSTNTYKPPFPVYGTEGLTMVDWHLRR